MVALNKTYRKTLTPDRSAKDSGHRYYSPEISRWLNRDPIGENGEANLVLFVWNSPVNLYDYLGLQGGAAVPVYDYEDAPLGAYAWNPNWESQWEDLVARPGFIQHDMPRELQPRYHRPGRYRPIPYAFSHPADEGEPCCDSPSNIESVRVTTWGSFPWTVRLNASIVPDRGAHDVQWAWHTCWRWGGRYSGFAGSISDRWVVLPGAGVESRRVTFYSASFNILLLVRWLSCEGDGSPTWVYREKTYQYGVAGQRASYQVTPGTVNDTSTGRTTSPYRYGADHPYVQYETRPSR
jgi:RHS repeat-associated protein